MPNDFDVALDKIRQAKLAASSVKGEKLVDLDEAARHTNLTRAQLYRYVGTGRLKACPVGGMLGEMTSKFLVKLSDVEKLTAAPRGRPRHPIGIDD